MCLGPSRVYALWPANVRSHVGASSVDEVPVVDEPQAPHVEPENLSACPIVAAIELVDEDEERGQALLWIRDMRSFSDSSSGVAKPARDGSLRRHRDGDEDISLAVFAGPTLEEARHAGDPVRTRLLAQGAPDGGNGQIPSSQLENDTPSAKPDSVRGFRLKAEAT